jgi:uncharacterized protein (TIGR02145 family)
MFAQEETGVEINGIIWATRNVGAPNTFVDNPEDFGMLYQWNSTVGWSATDPLVSSDGSRWNPNWTGNGGNGVTWSNNVCPAGWRIPTPEEFISLADADGEWTTLNDVNGYRFFDGDNSIFLPAAGSRDFLTSNAVKTGQVGGYWHNLAWYAGSSLLSFSWNKVNPPGGLHVSWAIANSIRCVKDGGTDVNDVSSDMTNAQTVGYYDILGRKLKEEPEKGIYIIRYDSGKTTKVIR